jgi:hypothetical protein
MLGKKREEEYLQQQKANDKGIPISPAWKKGRTFLRRQITHASKGLSAISDSIA